MLHKHTEHTAAIPLFGYMDIHRRNRALSGQVWGWQGYCSLGKWIIALPVKTEKSIQSSCLTTSQHTINNVAAISPSLAQSITSPVHVSFGDDRLLSDTSRHHQIM